MERTYVYIIRFLSRIEFNQAWPAKCWVMMNFYWSFIVNHHTLRIEVIIIFWWVWSFDIAEMITLRWLHNSLFNRFNLPAVSKFIISRAIYNSVYIVAPVNHHLRKLFFYLSFLRHFYLGHAILYRLNNRIFQANTIVLYGRVPTRKSHSSYYSVLKVLRWRCEVVSWKKKFTKNEVNASDLFEIASEIAV